MLPRSAGHLQTQVHYCCVDRAYSAVAAPGLVFSHLDGLSCFASEQSDCNAGEACLGRWWSC